MTTLAAILKLTFQLLIEKVPELGEVQWRLETGSRLSSIRFKLFTDSREISKVISWQEASAARSPEIHIGRIIDEAVEELNRAALGEK